MRIHRLISAAFSSASIVPCPIRGSARGLDDDFFRARNGDAKSLCAGEENGFGSWGPKKGLRDRSTDWGGAQTHQRAIWPGPKRPSGWRFLLRQENEAIASAETMVDEAGVHQFASFNRGPYVEATQDALDVASGIDADPDVPYEPRLLDVPALHARALWLHEPNPSGDKEIPMAPAPDRIEPRRVYDLDAYVEILRGLARDLGDFSDEDGLGG